MFKSEDWQLSGVMERREVEDSGRRQGRKKRTQETVGGVNQLLMRRSSHSLMLPKHFGY